ncbi:Staygreen protein [Macleaya cordata]|uniref:Staygreen protein n=1 Tax=Macleaya cordata TaxID=56857 RepID=A0A200PVD6_MACCD|nr:Staygreen protein [Macleaya cordata]
MACYSPSPSSSSSSSSCSSTSHNKRGFFFISSNNNNNKNKNKNYYSSASYSTKRTRNTRTVNLISSSLIDERRSTYSSSYNPLVFQAARLLGPPARFEASKLKVVFVGEDHQEINYPRTYTLSHCDLTANLTLTISNAITLDQLKGWYNRDDVVAEWKKVNQEMCLHVHCHVSGPNVLLDVAAEFRYHIFTKELPLVLQAVLHGDSMFFKEHPELMDALVWVYFHSSSKKYNRVECWGALKGAAQRDLRLGNTLSWMEYNVGHAWVVPEFSSCLCRAGLKSCFYFVRANGPKRSAQHSPRYCSGLGWHGMPKSHVGSCRQARHGPIDTAALTGTMDVTCACSTKVQGTPPLGHGKIDQPDVINQENSVRKFKPPTTLSSSSVEVSSKQSSVLPKRCDQSTPQKRASPGSPVVSRQKSFRRESADQTDHKLIVTSTTSLTARRNSSACYYSNSSPIRSRTNGGSDMCKGISRDSSPNKKFNNHRREFGNSKSKAGNVQIHDHQYYYYYSPSTTNKENFRPGSPFNRNQNSYGSWRKRETCTTTTTTTHHVHPDYHEVVDQNSSPSVLGEGVYGDKDLDSLQIDDLDNPLISLDCFIFL